MSAHRVRELPACLASICALLLVLCLAPLAGAQPLWPDVVDTIEVRAPRIPPVGTLAPRTSFATVIPLGPEAPVGRDLADLLDRTAGIQVHRYGGLGAFSQAGVRGSSPGQVLVCIDGVPVASAGDGHVDLALLPVSLFGRAEVLRGSQTASYGGPPAAGVINLVSPADLRTTLRLTGGGGSFGTAYGRALWGGSRGPASAYLATQFRRSEGDFEYRNRNGTYFGNTADDRIERRRNNAFEDVALLGKGSLRWPRSWGAADALASALRTLRLDYTGLRFERDGGVPGTENVQTRETRFRTRRVRHELAAQFAVAPRMPVFLEGAAHHERIRDRFDNREGEVGLGRAATDNRTRDRGGRARARWDVRPLHQQVAASWQRRSEEWTPHDRLRGTTGYTRARRHLTWSVEDRARLGRLEVEGAYHWAEARDNYAGGEGWGQPSGPSAIRTRRFEGPTFGIRADCGGGLLLKGNRGRMARFPTFPELFGQNGVQQGNPALRNEWGLQWDAGFSWAPGRPWRVESAYFESITRDKITLIQNSQRTVKAMNLDRAWVRGVESSGFLRLRLPWRNALELQSSFTWQEAKDVGRSPTYRGKDLPCLPEREAFVSADLLRAAWKFRWEASARSAHYRDRANSDPKRSPASIVHGAAVTRSFRSESITLRAEATNLFDRRIEDIDGFPLPGRTLTAELSWTWE